MQFWRGLWEPPPPWEPAGTQWDIPRWEDPPADQRPWRLRWWYRAWSRARWPLAAYRLKRRTGWKRWAPRHDRP